MNSYLVLAVRLLRAIALVSGLIFSSSVYAQASERPFIKGPDGTNTEFESMSWDCRVCHGQDGNSPQFPGVPAIGNHTRMYFIHALNQYRRGERQLNMESNPYAMMMIGPAARLTDEDVELLADHFTDAPFKRELIEFPNEVLENNQGVKVLLYGASGAAGQELSYEALSRGYTVYGVSRNPARLQFDHPNFIAVQGSLTDWESVQQVFNDVDPDVIVSAAASMPSNTRMGSQITVEETVQVQAAENMIKLLGPLGDEGPRFIQVGGATSLDWKGEHSYDVFLQDPTIMGSMPPPNTLTGIFFKANVESLARLRASEGIRWTNITPGLHFDLGPRTGEFCYAREEMIVGANGHSRISRADLAVAIFDEIDREEHIKSRFTVSYCDDPEYYADK